MSWTLTHRRWEAIREIEALAAAGCDELPWNTEYAELFGDRAGLAAALQYRWQLASSTQLDSHLTETQLEDQRTRIDQRYAPVLRMLRAFGSGAPSYSEAVSAPLPDPVTAA